MTRFATTVLLTGLFIGAGAGTSASAATDLDLKYCFNSNMSDADRARAIAPQQRVDERPGRSTGLFYSIRREMQWCVVPQVSRPRVSLTGSAASLRKNQAN